MDIKDELTEAVRQLAPIDNGSMGALIETMVAARERIAELEATLARTNSALHNAAQLAHDLAATVSAAANKAYRVLDK